jgi:serine/threonine-protein kinase
MGEVYLVNHPRLPRLEALKVLPTDVSADPEFRERFHREADLAASLWHPHIVGVHDQGEYEGQLWISMDYVDGADSAQLLSQRYRAGFPRDQAIEIIGAVASALDYAHERGLLHRDVKPANVLIGSDGAGDQRIMLADFGIARRINDISGLTATNVVVGTVAYAAPEQLTGSTIDGRTDQYALGATAYQLLCGETPFKHPNPAIVIGCHLNSAPPKMAAARPDLADLDDAVSRALAKRPNARFASCRDFAAALRGATQIWPDDSGTAAASQPIPPTVESQTLASANTRSTVTGPTRPQLTPTEQSSTPKTQDPVVPVPGRTTSARKHKAPALIVIGVVALATIALVGTLLLTRHKTVKVSEEEQVRHTIQQYDIAVQRGDLTALRSITCGTVRDGYVDYDEHAWQETYQRVSAAKQYPVIASIDQVVVNGQHAVADVTSFMAYDPSVRSTRSLDLQYRDNQWKICQSPGG